MLIENIATLEDLWEYTKKLHKDLFPRNKLSPIMSGGKINRPKYMFIFINPTYRNISSDPAWEGKRRPWIGTKYIWSIFHKANLFEDSLLNEINTKKVWDIDFADKVYGYLEKKGYYFTNLVKWTGSNADLPDKTKIQSFLPILKKEIELLKPKYIITFGLIPFNALVNKQLKLTEYYESSVGSAELEMYEIKLNNKIFSVIPCYFPVGRGNPKRAIELLRLLPN